MPCSSKHLPISIWLKISHGCCILNMYEGFYYSMSFAGYTNVARCKLELTLDIAKIKFSSANKLQFDSEIASKSNYFQFSECVNKNLC